MQRHMHTHSPSTKIHLI